MTLIKQAQQGELPGHQMMDLDTLEWIISQRPDLNFEDKLDLTISANFKRWCRLNASNFLNVSVSKSIHGIRHSLRVAIYAYLLAKQNESSEDFACFCAIAGLLHDTCRIHDRDDIGHGKRCAERIMARDVKHPALDQISHEDMKRIALAIEFHDVNYCHIENLNTYKNNKSIIDIVKTADALDRYRLPKIKWWIRDDLIRIIPDDKMRRFAFDLVVASESLFLEGIEPCEAVLMAIHKIK